MNQFIRIEEVATMIGVSRRTLERMVATGSFIKPIKLTARTLGWEKTMLEEYLKERQACAQQ
ncbi:helix-turn-helix transcriptional regulator [Pseudomonas sp. A-R-19]|uniref:helix-turn-helix transcriptional regulator n=1 Tax=Pseudomonas sp. A-R-19 TaxID=2832403 RepID=UPI001CBDAF8C|nr:AlpA family phage regulatory protein [Pseudomonas sp. A-R-19]